VHELEAEGHVFKLMGSETRQQVKQKECQMTHGSVLEKTSTRRSKNTHISDSVVSHSFSALARGGDAARGDSSFPLARPRNVMEIEDEGRCGGGAYY
jgi:hypothetical protein